MATPRTPLRASSARAAWSSGASGVVRPESVRRVVPYSRPSVVICPDGSAVARHARTSWQVVVFPLVPVTPTTSSQREGAP